MTHPTPDNDLVRAFAEAPEPVGLDPDAVLTDARHRARRRTGLATAVAGTVVAGAMVASQLLPGSGDATLEAAGQPTSSTSSTAASQTPSAPASASRPASSPAAAALPAARTIPASTWVKIDTNTWFATFGTEWCIAEQNTAPKGRPDESWNLPFGCRGTVGNTNLGRTNLSGLQGSGTADHSRHTSVFTGSPETTAIVVGGKRYPGQIWHLEGIPGWNLGMWTLPADVEDAPGNTFGHPEKAGKPDLWKITTWRADGTVDATLDSSFR